jgi:hypothetical protein
MAVVLLERTCMGNTHDRVALVLVAALAVASVSGGSDARAQRDAPAPTLADTAACAETARRRTELVPTQIRRLCVATPSPTAPVDCYVAATRTLLLTDPQGIELCRCTATLGPIECVRALRDAALLTDPEMVEACSPTITRALRADCTPIP